MSLYASVRNWIQEIPDHIKTQICAKAVHIKTFSLKFAPDYCKIQEMIAEVVCKELYLLEFVSVHLKN